LTYLDPPPAPAPVIVMKDVGGLVRDYQAQTELYRESDREVRIHECHSACTLALSLPNVCVYPDSIFKFHQAYNLRNHRTDFGVSDQLFESYPIAVRGRLGTLTRQFKVLSGAELISLGVRDCNTPRIMLAKTLPSSRVGGEGVIARVWTSVISAFASKPTASGGAPRAPTLVATRQQTEAERNLPAEALYSGVPLPPPRPTSLAIALSQTMPPIALPKVIQGAQPILPPHFLAYAMIARLRQ
jgi:hypothetical protein